ncbi:MAG: domain containing protein [Nocardioides sp.]|nr:domain containing protein [Nocardioides sp.]
MPTRSAREGLRDRDLAVENGEVTPGVSGDVSAADALGPLWRRRVADVRLWESELRAQRPEAVHGFRVSTRRLRSCLAGFAPVLDAAMCRALAENLRLTAEAVGGARDVEVLRDRIAGLAEGAGSGPAELADRLLPRLQESAAEGRQRSIAHLDSAEYDALVRRLEGFADLPPWQRAAEGRAKEVLRPLLRSEWSRFRKRGRAALEPGATDATLHAARKAAKRARYVSEALVPVFGRKARRLGLAAEGVQDALGEFQDTVVTRAFLVDAGRPVALGAAEHPFLVRMQEREAEAAGVHRAEFARLFAEADRKSLRAWLR